MKITTRAIALIAALAMFGAACGSAPDEEASPSETATSSESTTPSETTSATESPAGSETAAAADYTACEVTDTGGVDDRSFNQTAYKGVKDAESDLGIQGKVLESQSAADFEPNINAFLQQDCSLIITVGFLLGDATKAAAEANTDQHFAIVDFAYEETIPNVRELTFSTDQAAFLAGYVAAATTETGKVGTYGGMNIPTVTIFMDGYLAGVRYYNQEKGKDVQVIGWDGSEGQFTGDFENQDKGRSITEQELQNGADIIMPVAGPVGQGSGAAVQAAGTGKLIWVDTDGYVSAPQFKDLMLTSVMKNMDVAVHDTIAKDVKGSFEGGRYVGTLDNDGVGIAPFHDFEDKVPQELKDELDQIRQQIIAGDLSVKPADYQ